MLVSGNLTNMTTDADACEISVVGNILDFHSSVAGSNPAPRSKDRRIGKWANCKQCGSQFASYKYNGKWRVFCSVRCRNVWLVANRKALVPRRGRAGIPGPIPKRIRGNCADCGIALPSYQSKRCRNCHFAGVKNRQDTRTIGDLIGSDYSHRNRYQRIRSKAIQIAKRFPQACCVCGYSKHIEVAHIRAISNFDLSEPVSAVNALDNLALLCPNHHWELDNNKLEAPITTLAG